MTPLEFIYHTGLSLKKRMALKNQVTLPFPVVSIGNLTVGGTGKTPTAIALAQEARRRGFQPVILTRGYRGKAKGPCFVSRGAGPLMSPRDAGDEPYLMAQRLRGVPIVKGADRYQAGMLAIRELSLADEQTGDSACRPLFILDDGFQHWRLHRDRDIVLVDAARPFGNGRLLPLGSLREPAEALGRADVIVMTRCSSDAGESELRDLLRRYNRRSPVFRAQHAVAAVRSAHGELLEPGSLANRKAFGFCALGNPGSFRETIGSIGLALAGFRAFRDHHRFTEQDLSAVVADAAKAGADVIVTSEKDAVKMAHLALPQNLLIIEIEFVTGAGFYDTVLIPGGR